MERVPITFCDSVCALVTWADLSDFSAIASRIWCASATRESDSREMSALFVGYDWKEEDGVLRRVWTYDFLRSKRSASRSISFQELKQINRRRVQVGSIQLRRSPVVQRISTWEEIVQISTFTFPFLVHDSWFLFGGYRFPEIEQSWLLSFYQNTPFSYIELYNNGNLEDFLMIQLQSDRLREIRLCKNGWSAEAQAAVEEFALSRPFKSIRFNYDTMISFGGTFLGQLLQKPLVGITHSEFEAQFSASFDDVKDYIPHLCEDGASGEVHVIESGMLRIFDKIVWTRADGVRATVQERLFGSLCQLSIQFDR